MLDDVFVDGADNDGLALSKVDQVGGDLRAVVTWGVPADTQAGRGRVDQRRRQGIVIILFIIVLCVC